MLSPLATDSGALPANSVPQDRYAEASGLFFKVLYELETMQEQHAARNHSRATRLQLIDGLFQAAFLALEAKTSTVCRSAPASGQSSRLTYLTVVDLPPSPTFLEGPCCFTWKKQMKAIS